MADPDELRVEYVPLSTVVLWDRNPKRHDIGGIVQSIERYGFKDPPKFEPKLNDGKGGIVEGNGRTVCLAMMRDEGRDPPRGILLNDGDWAVPVLFGVDAESERAAEAYAVDHNNLTMTGGDFDGFDIARMWGPDYTDLLKNIGAVPVSVGEEQLEAIVRGAATLFAEPPEEFPEFDEDLDVDYMCPKCGYSWSGKPK